MSSVTPSRKLEAMQSSQDEESPWVEDGDAPLHHAEAEWTSLSTSFTTVSERKPINSDDNNPHR
jgi:hypothetical protein